jgi:hypothetical protein
MRPGAGGLAEPVLPTRRAAQGTPHRGRTLNWIIDRAEALVSQRVGRISARDRDADKREAGQIKTATAAKEGEACRGRSWELSGFEWIRGRWFSISRIARIRGGSREVELILHLCKLIRRG